MSFTIHVLALNQEKSAQLNFDSSIELLNEIDNKDYVHRYGKIWPFLMQTKGILYYLGAEYDGDCTSFAICDVDVESKRVTRPYWINYQRLRYYLDPLIIKPEYRNDFEKILRFLIEQSPDKTILFHTRYQGGDEEVICGVLTPEKFLKLLDNKKILFNTCYIIRPPAPPPEVISNCDEILENLKALINAGHELDNDSLNNAYLMVKADYEPIKDFFLEGLDNISPKWREECVHILRTQYPYLEDKYVDKFRELIVSDPDKDVRYGALLGLSIHGKQLDRNFVVALYKDPEYEIREFAFWVILKFCKLSTKQNIQVKERIKKGELELSLEGIKTVLSEHNLPVPDELLTIDLNSLNGHRD